MDGGVIDDSGESEGEAVVVEPDGVEPEGALVEPLAAPGTPDGPPPPGPPPFPPHPSNAIFDGVDDEVELNIPVDALQEADSEDESSRRFSSRFRSMSKSALLREASSPEHLASHFPHNPFCVVCIRAHMRQRRFARRSQADDDGIPPVTEPLKQLSSDTIIIAVNSSDKSRRSSSGCTTIHTIRDSFSGFTLAVPQHTHDTRTQIT